MGVPKFFRYISERYPCLSELVRENQVSFAKKIEIKFKAMSQIITIKDYQTLLCADRMLKIVEIFHPLT